MRRGARGMAALALCAAAGAFAHGPAPGLLPLRIDEARPFATVTGALAPATSVRDLKFRELFRLPVGPRGLELAPGAQALAGQRVRMVGYMANQDAGTGAPGTFILAPLPVLLGDEDEAQADDLPPTAVHVHMPPSHSARSLPHVAGLLVVTGTLELGSRAEADGRRSAIRIIQSEPDLLPPPGLPLEGKSP